MTAVHTWFCIDDHFLSRVGRWVMAVVGHIFTGTELQHFHEAQRHAPLEKEPLVQLGIAAAIAAAILTPEESSKSFVNE